MYPCRSILLVDFRHMSVEGAPVQTKKVVSDGEASGSRRRPRARYEPRLQAVRWRRRGPQSGALASDIRSGGERQGVEGDHVATHGERSRAPKRLADPQRSEGDHWDGIRQLF
jgi:hypothetical protein